MAINVNTVYKNVLSILNKEQRGYITPDEFNRIGREAQINMLDVAFMEYNRMLNLDNVNRTNLGYADLPSRTKEKIDAFYKTSSLSLSGGTVNLPTDIYKLIDLTITNKTISLEQVDKHEIPYMLSSPLTKPTTDFPVYYKRATSDGATEIVVEPAFTDDAWTLGNVTCDYIKLPTQPRWGYTVNATYGTNTYDSNPYSSTGLIIGLQNGLGFITSGNTQLMDGTQTITVGTTSGITTSGSGTGLTLTLVIDSNAITSITVDAAGSGWAAGDTITIGDTLSWTGSDDIVLTVRTSDLYVNSTQGSVDFELHPSEEPQLIMQILAFAGVTIKDQEITSLASQSLQNNAVAKQQ